MFYFCLRQGTQKKLFLPKKNYQMRKGGAKQETNERHGVWFLSERQRILPNPLRFIPPPSRKRRGARPFFLFFCFSPPFFVYFFFFLFLEKRKKKKKKKKAQKGGEKKRERKCNPTPFGRKTGLQETNFVFWGGDLGHVIFFFLPCPLALRFLLSPPNFWFFWVSGWGCKGFFRRKGGKTAPGEETTIFYYSEVL
jgi:hypothetical protein